MDITLILQSIAGLFAVLIILIILLLLQASKRKKAAVINKRAVNSQKQTPKTDIESLKAIIKNNATTTQELQNTLELIIKHHGKLHKKLGLRVHPDFEQYEDILFRMCRHPNVNKEIILKFDKDLASLNPDYKQEISNMVSNGLNSRQL